MDASIAIGPVFKRFQSVVITSGVMWCALLRTVLPRVVEDSLSCVEHVMIKLFTEATHISH